MEFQWPPVVKCILTAILPLPKTWRRKKRKIFSIMLGPLVIPFLSSKTPEVTFGPFRFPQTPSLSHWDPLVNPLDTLGPSRLPILPYKSSEDQSVINCGFLDLPLDPLVHLADCPAVSFRFVYLHSRRWEPSISWGTFETVLQRQK